MPPVCVLDYRQFRKAPAQGLETALTHAGFTVSAETCEAALQSVWQERAQFRFNQGVSGRGRQVFTPAHIARLSRLLGYYPQLESWTTTLMEDQLGALA
ncbi:MAG TPA: hypothetical protein VGI89_04395 [Rhizomicrobium sp.]|jgi:hypothetical protein